MNFRSISFLLILSFFTSFKTLEAQNKEIISKFLFDNKESLGLSTEDITEWSIYDEYQSKHNEVYHIHIRQNYKGIEIYNAVANFNIKDAKVISMGDRLIRNISTKVNTTIAVISPEAAIQKAAEQLNLTFTEPLKALEPVNNQHFVFSNGGISLENIPVKLMYQPGPEGELILSWDLSIYQIDAKHWWSLRVDAQNGKIIDKSDWVVSCSFDNSDRNCNNPSHKHNITLAPSYSNNNALPEQYRVFAEPVESPNHGIRSLKINPSDVNASPWGWHDDNGITGAEYTITRGNNVYAYEDRDDDNAPGYSPDGTAALNFDFPLNLNQAPANYQDAAITNLFYWNNLMHDVWYKYGFDENSGNFQQNNYGRGGLATDYVQAEAQDGGGTNNANFATPTDGTRPRMQMYLWTGGGGASNLLTVNSPSSISGPYSATQASFGPGVPAIPITSDVVIADDGTSPNDDGCTSLQNSNNINGKIALVFRGNCNFSVKVANAQAAGALAVIVVNNVAGAPITMGGTDPSITIPSIMISDVDGASIVNQINSGQTVNATIVDNTGNFDKDGDFDNVVIAHEYGHGISIRLTGGPSNSNCLNNSEQMGEGWSDFFGLMMTMEPGDAATDIRGIGTFATGQPTSGTGIRNAPYTTNMSVNPFTYADVNNTANVSEPHGVGFVWCTMLWDLNWALINQYGFDPDLYNGSGGNNIAMQLVIDGIKLQPCNPGFVDGRDAILRADSILYNGANQCLIWEVFARRGLGFSADQGSSNNRSDQVEAFDIPSLCQTPVVAPTASFSNSLLSSCGGTVKFVDQSTDIPQSWFWDFGDGNSSSAQNPTHTYTASGAYTVRLIVTNTIGSDTSFVTVNIGLPAAPTVNPVSICAGQTATLNGNATGDIIWYDQSGNALDTAITFTTPTLTTTTTYYAENATFFQAQNVGALDGSIGTGGYHNTGFTGTQNFTAFKGLTINSAWLDAGSAGIRTVYLWSGSNGTGAVVDSVILNIPSGPQRVTLNLEVPGPGDYSLGGTTIDMYRNNSGANYPYIISNLISINSSSATTNALDFWYYLYDWEVQETTCRSAQTGVTVTVDGAAFTYNQNGLDVDFTDISSNASSWAWDFGDGNSSTDQNPQHGYASPGTYTVSLVINDNTNCTYTQTVTITASNSNSIADFNAELLPNPANNKTTVYFNTPLQEDVQMQLIALDGKVIKEETFTKGSDHKIINLENLSPAMYLIRLTGYSIQKTLKLTVSK